VIILASRSPQRRALLRAIGVEHRVVTSTYGEDDLPGLTPPELVASHARAKAADVAARAGVPPGGAVLGADTVVLLGDRVLGKSADRAEAAEMLRGLSGVAHRVLTAVCLRTGAGVHERVDGADVTFTDITPRHLDWYLDRGEWQGRAGAYAIQGSGATLVAGVNGDFTTVVGLSVRMLSDMLVTAGLAPWGPAPG